MEAALFTTVLLILMGVALIVLGRGWPRTSRLGGYHARMRGGAADVAAREQARDTPIREDDDARWRWDDRGDAPRP
ncbi:MAG: hypothetical protein AB1627_02485 [Chloroflexota bacterium]